MLPSVPLAKQLASSSSVMPRVKSHRSNLMCGANSPDAGSLGTCLTPPVSMVSPRTTHARTRSGNTAPSDIQGSTAEPPPPRQPAQDAPAGSVGSSLGGALSTPATGSRCQYPATRLITPVPTSRGAPTRSFQLHYVQFMYASV